MKVLAKFDLKNNGDLKDIYTKLREENTLPVIDHFGRMNSVSRLMLCAAARVLKKAGVRVSKDEKQNIGLFLTNSSGCLKDNEDFFNDYLKGGRRLARANLFIYTLPTSPLAECAIAFNFYGPISYFPAMTMKELEKTAGLMIQSTDTKKFLLFKADEKRARVILIGE